MKILKFFFFFLIVGSNSLFAQKLGEEIVYLEEKGIYLIHYWSEVDSVFYEIPLFPGNECTPSIITKVIFDNDSKNYTYSYEISNESDAKRELYEFGIYTPSPVSQIKLANSEWRGKYFSWLEGVRWVQSNSKSDTIGVLPGEKVTGEFGFKATELPGIVVGYAASYWNLGNTPDEGPTGEMRVMADSILKETKNISFKTIGPRQLADNINNISLLDTLYSYLDFSCDTTWIENRGVCQSLQAKLDNTRRQLDRNNNRAASNSLQAFLNEVMALKDEQLSSEAYALLYFNGQYLLERLQE